MKIGSDLCYLGLSLTKKFSRTCVIPQSKSISNTGISSHKLDLFGNAKIAMNYTTFQTILRSSSQDRTKERATDSWGCARDAWEPSQIEPTTARSATSACSRWTTTAHGWPIVSASITTSTFSTCSSTPVLHLHSWWSLLIRSSSLS